MIPQKSQSHKPTAGEIDEEKPIFIVGAPRSGTSLLREILNRHPRIGICDETYFFYYVYSRKRAFGDINRYENRVKLVNNFLQLRRFKRLNLDEKKLKEILLENSIDYDSFFITLISYYSYVHGKTRCGEKTPQHAMYTQVLCDLYPQSRIIHIIRDPRAAVASIIRMPWASKNLVENSNNWVKLNLAASRSSQRPNYLLVSYERLIEEPEEQLRRICEFIGEEFKSQMLESNNENNLDGTPEEWWFRRARNPVTKERSEIWKNELSPPQIELIEWIARPVMNQFGYQTISKAPSILRKFQYLSEYVVSRLFDIFRHPKRLWFYWFQPTRISQEESLIDSISFG